MNILLITQMYSQPDDVGDNKPTKTVNYFARDWSNLGHNVVVMHCPSKFPLCFYLLPMKIKERFANKISTMVPCLSSRKNISRKEGNVDVYRLPMLKMFPGKGYSERALKKQAKKIENILKKIQFNPDLVSGHFANPSLGLVNILCKKYNSKSSIVFHQDCNERTLSKYRISEKINSIKAIGARSLVEANSIKKLLGLTNMPFVCCSGAPNDAVECAAKVCTKNGFDNGVKFLYVGSLIARKHLDSVIKSFDKTADEKDSLKIVGGGPEFDSLKLLADKAKNSSRITFTGRVERKQALEEMKNANIFTLISDGEAFGMVYIEAMLQGCLVVASKGGGFDGIIKDGINGFLCNPGDIEMLISIYKKIKAMNKEERNKIGQSAIDTAIHYSENEVAERYLNDILERNMR